MFKLRTFKLHIAALARHPLKKHKRQNYIESQLAEGAVDHSGLWRSPLVSVVIVSFNSRDDLTACLESVKQQSYSRIEIVVVENGHLDAADLVRTICPDAKYIRAPTNLGFAEGNNFAMRHVTGEYVLLVNPDARLDEDCLYELLSAFRRDAALAVAAPKLRFWTRFVDVEVRSPYAFEIDATALVEQLSYKKFFVRCGETSGNGSQILSVRSPTAYRILLRLPVDGSALRLPIEALNGLMVLVNGKPITMVGDAAESFPILSLTSSARPNAFWVINNAGSGIRKGIPYDIGFAEADDGRADGQRHVPSFCGCVALIKRAALIGQDLFRPEFFAYFEDSELALRLGRAGHTITYTPRAIAYHKHSAAFSEHSPLWTTLVGRSRLIYQTCAGAKNAPEALQRWLADAKRYNSLPQSLASILSELDLRIGASGRPHRRIGVFNSWWATFGGGELHALCILREIAGPQDEIFLISDKDFDMDELFRRFHFDMEDISKLVVVKMTSDLTARFDVFINASYCSNLVSHAASSYYIVSFPHRGLSKKAKKSYIFLFNSQFTKKWADRFWGPVRGEIIYPTHSLALDGDGTLVAKEKIVITVGRITRSGHAKNPDAVIEAFAKAKARGGLDDWRLCVVGTVDPSRPEDLAFLEDLKRAAAGDDKIQVIANCLKSELDLLFARAAIYVHAAGLNQSPDAPEKHEHFGISTLEACMHGCFPIVYHLGGPADLLTTLGTGCVYSNEQEMVEVLAEQMRRDCGALSAATSRSARKFCADNAVATRRLLEHLH